MRLLMKSGSTRAKQPAPKRPKGNLRKQIGYLAIAFVSAGLVLILGSNLAQLFSPAPPKLTPQASLPPQPILATRSPIVPDTLPSPGIATPIAKKTPAIAPSPIPQAKPKVQTAFGHLPYGEDSPDRLISIGKFVRENYEREEYLNLEAAQAFQIMVNAARVQGVQLMGISGFRSIADQQALFDKQIEKRGSAEAAAKLSAPPGHSEHHTGYAIDITDASRTDVDLNVAFEETNAYQWLIINAKQYGFEQSFPQNNPQGVSYEPWHWRFVGSDRSATIFAVAHNP
jgi:zinc D-Ala-D-Ala carboxypeptidase